MPSYLILYTENNNLGISTRTHLPGAKKRPTPLKKNLLALQTNWVSLPLFWQLVLFYNKLFRS